MAQVCFSLLEQLLHFLSSLFSFLSHAEKERWIFCKFLGPFLALLIQITDTLSQSSSKLHVLSSLAEEKLTSIKLAITDLQEPAVDREYLGSG